MKWLHAHIHLEKTEINQNKTRCILLNFTLGLSKSLKLSFTNKDYRAETILSQPEHRTFSSKTFLLSSGVPRIQFEK